MGQREVALNFLQGVGVDDPTGHFQLCFYVPMWSRDAISETDIFLLWLTSFVHRGCVVFTDQINLNMHRMGYLLGGHVIN